MLEIILLSIIAFIAGFALGWARGFHRAISNLIHHYAEDPTELDRAFKNVREAALEIKQAQQSAEELVITLEQINGQYYAYSPQGEFLGQGTDKEQVQTQALERLARNSD